MARHPFAAYLRGVEGPVPPSAIDRLLDDCREQLQRVEPSDLHREVEAGALIVDMRPLEQRRCDGDLPGALVIDRNVLEWRLDPTSPYRIPEVTTHEIRVIVVCNEGFSSSIAAATLQRLGLSRATDLIGGYQAWVLLNSADTPSIRQLR